MTVLALDHVNLRTAEPERTIGFFRDVLMMKVGGPPGMPADGKGAWIYDGGDRPVIHIGSVDMAYPTDDRLPFTPGKGGGAVHHVALGCADFEGVKARLGRLGVEFTESHFPAFDLHQIFVSEPNGVLLELNFRSV
jgi:catechol 2,3-dioxygenase-like lactoylglutathione lyase family enzyme